MLKIVVGKTVAKLRLYISKSTGNKWSAAGVERRDVQWRWVSHTDQRDKGECSTLIDEL